MKISISKLAHDESTDLYSLAERNTSYDTYAYDTLLSDTKKVRKFRDEDDVKHKTYGKKFRKKPEPGTNFNLV